MSVINVTLARIILQFVAKTDEMDRALRNSSKGISEFSVAVAKAGTAFLAAGGAMAPAFNAMLGPLKNAVSLAKDVQTQFNRVTTIMESGRKAADLYNKELVILSRTYGVDLKDAVQGLYNAISAGIPESKAIQVLTEGAKLARVGVTDLDTAVGAIRTTLNTYNIQLESVADSTKELEKISGKLFQTVDFATFPFEDLAKNIGKVLPVSKMANVSLDETLAALAALSRNGLPNASLATTALINTLLGFVKPTEKSKKAVMALNQQLGLTGDQALELSSAFLSKHGLQGSLEMFVKAVGGNIDKLIQIFSRKGGIQGVAALAADEFRNMGMAFDEISGSIPGISKEFQTMQDLTMQLNQTAAEFNAILYGMGSSQLPTASKALTYLNNELKKFNEWMTMHPAASKFFAGMYTGVALFGKGLSDVLIQLGYLSFAILGIRTVFGKTFLGALKAVLGTFTRFAKSQYAIRTAMETLEKTVKAGITTWKEYGAIIDRIAGGVEFKIAKEIATATRDTVTLGRELDYTNKAFDKFGSAARQARIALQEHTAVVADTADDLRKFSALSDDLTATAKIMWAQFTDGATVARSQVANLSVVFKDFSTLVNKTLATSLLRGGLVAEDYIKFSDSLRLIFSAIDVNTIKTFSKELQGLGFVDAAKNADTLVVKLEQLKAVSDVLRSTKLGVNAEWIKLGVLQQLPDDLARATRAVADFDLATSRAAYSLGTNMNAAVRQTSVAVDQAGTHVARLSAKLAGLRTRFEQVVPVTIGELFDETILGREAIQNINELIDAFDQLSITIGSKGAAITDVVKEQAAGIDALAKGLSEYNEVFEQIAARTGETKMLKNVKETRKAIAELTETIMKLRQTGGILDEVAMKKAADALESLSKGMIKLDIPLNRQILSIERWKTSFMSAFKAFGAGFVDLFSVKSLVSLAWFQVVMDGIIELLKGAFNWYNAFREAFQNDATFAALNARIDMTVEKLRSMGYTITKEQEKLLHELQQNAQTSAFLLPLEEQLMRVIKQFDSLPDVVLTVFRFLGNTATNFVAGIVDILSGVSYYLRNLILDIPTAIIDMLGYISPELGKLLAPIRAFYKEVQSKANEWHKWLKDPFDRGVESVHKYFEEIKQGQYADDEIGGIPGEAGLQASIEKHKASMSELGKAQVELVNMVKDNISKATDLTADFSADQIESIEHAAQVSGQSIEDVAAGYRIYLKDASFDLHKYLRDLYTGQTTKEAALMAWISGLSEDTATQMVEQSKKQYDEQGAAYEDYAGMLKEGYADDTEALRNKYNIDLNVFDEYTRNLTDRRKSYEDQLEKLRKKKEELTDAFITGGQSQEELNALLQQLSAVDAAIQNTKLGLYAIMKEQQESLDPEKQIEAINRVRKSMGDMILEEQQIVDKFAPILSQQFGLLEAETRKFVEELFKGLNESQRFVMVTLLENLKDAQPKLYAEVIKGGEVAATKLRDVIVAQGKVTTDEFVAVARTAVDKSADAMGSEADKPEIKLKVLATGTKTGITMAEGVVKGVVEGNKPEELAVALTQPVIDEFSSPQSNLNIAIQGWLQTLLAGFAGVGYKIGNFFSPNQPVPKTGMLPNNAVPFAKGGVTDGGLAVVGEKGRELVALPRGTTVLDAGRSSKIMGMVGNVPGYARGTAGLGVEADRNMMMMLLVSAGYTPGTPVFEQALNAYMTMYYERGIGAVKRALSVEAGRQQAYYKPRQPIPPTTHTYGAGRPTATYGVQSAVGTQQEQAMRQAAQAAMQAGMIANEKGEILDPSGAVWVNLGGRFPAYDGYWVPKDRMVDVASIMTKYYAETQKYGSTRAAEDMMAFGISGIIKAEGGAKFYGKPQYILDEQNKAGVGYDAMGNRYDAGGKLTTPDGDRLVQVERNKYLPEAMAAEYVQIKQAALAGNITRAQANAQLQLLEPYMRDGQFKPTGRGAVGDAVGTGGMSAAGIGPAAPEGMPGLPQQPPLPRGWRGDVHGNYYDQRGNLVRRGYDPTVSFKWRHKDINGNLYDQYGNIKMADGTLITRDGVARLPDGRILQYMGDGMYQDVANGEVVAGPQLDGYKLKKYVSSMEYPMLTGEQIASGQRQAITAGADVPSPYDRGQRRGARLLHFEGDPRRMESKFKAAGPHAYSSYQRAMQEYEKMEKMAYKYGYTPRNFPTYSVVYGTSANYASGTYVAQKHTDIPDNAILAYDRTRSTFENRFVSALDQLTEYEAAQRSGKTKEQVRQEKRKTDKEKTADKWHGVLDKYRNASAEEIWLAYQNGEISYTQAKQLISARGKAMQEGGEVDESEWLLVGEEGPELVMMDAGANVLNAADTENALAMMGVVDTSVGGAKRLGGKTGRSMTLSYLGGDFADAAERQREKMFGGSEKQRQALMGHAAQQREKMFGPRRRLTTPTTQPARSTQTTTPVAGGRSATGGAFSGGQAPKVTTQADRAEQAAQGDAMNLEAAIRTADKYKLETFLSAMVGTGDAKRILEFKEWSTSDLAEYIIGTVIPESGKDATTLYRLWRASGSSDVNLGRLRGQASGAAKSTVAGAAGGGMGVRGDATIGGGARRKAPRGGGEGGPGPYIPPAQGGGAGPRGPLTDDQVSWVPAFVRAMNIDSLKALLRLLLGVDAANSLIETKEFTQPSLAAYIIDEVLPNTKLSNSAVADYVRRAARSVEKGIDMGIKGTGAKPIPAPSGGWGKSGGAVAASSLVSNLAGIGKQTTQATIAGVTNSPLAASSTPAGPVTQNFQVGMVRTDEDIFRLAQYAGRKAGAAARRTQ